MRTLTLLLSLLIAISASAEDFGKTYAEQAWAMWDRLDQGNEKDGDSWSNVIELFKDATTYGVKDVYNGIGYIYQHHANVLKNDIPTDKYAAMIEDYYNQAIANGSTQAIFNLATCYRKGDSFIGFEKNFNKALSLYHMGSNQGNAFCLNALGLLYKDKEISSNNNYPEVAAFECFSKAYENMPKNCPAIYSLAECYEKGEGVKRDEAKAFALYLEGSEYNDYAAAKVGLFYEEGRVVEKDLNKAYEYYSKATENAFLDEWIMQHYYHVAHILGKEDSEYIEVEAVSPAVR